MKIKDLPENMNLGEVKFKHPETGEVCYWASSQWGYPEGKAGVWYRTDPSDTQIHAIFLDSLEEALEFELVEDPDND